MKILFILALLCSPLSATNWYVRADGGGRYSTSRAAAVQSANLPVKFAGCDGQADLPYPGAGTNQHCAFNDYRLLWDAQVDYQSVGWAIAGGDTVILDNTQQWRIGFDGDGTGGPWPTWNWGGSGPYGAINPPIPAGTAMQHTRILGRNYANCPVGKETQIFGGHGIYTALNLSGAAYLDVQCIEVTRHSDCVTHGSPNLKPCHTSVPLDDYDSDGITTDLGTHDVLLQDMWIHGHTDRGIIGPIGGLVTANRINIDTNGMAGWDLDKGDGTPSPLGAITLTNSIIQFSGCNQEYPFVDPIPVASCYSQSTGGYGDGIGTPKGPMGPVVIDHDIFRYNTQDGEDFGHVYLSPSISITNSLSYGNNGGQFKWAGFTNSTFENNIAVANCARMSAPLSGAPATYNANLSDFCRADDALSFDFNNNATALLANNTIVTYAPTTFDVQCYDATSCAGTTLTLENNIVLGYDNPATYGLGGQSSGVGLYCLNDCNGSALPIGNIVRKNNLYWGVRGTCPATGNEVCADPLFTSEPSGVFKEALLDSFNAELQPLSPAITTGTPIPGLATDYLGAVYGQTPSLGAVQFPSAPVLVPAPTSVPSTTPTPAPTPVPTPVPVPSPAPPISPGIQILISPGSCTSSISITLPSLTPVCVPTPAAAVKRAP